LQLVTPRPEIPEPQVQNPKAHALQVDPDSRPQSASNAVAEESQSLMADKAPNGFDSIPFYTEKI